MSEMASKFSPEPGSSAWLKHALFPGAAILPFAAFNNRYAGKTCHVIGRGPTDFSFPDLANIPDPIFFINDAVCLEKFARSETFFFAHDARMLVWLDGAIRATAVLPLDGKLFLKHPGTMLNHTGKLVFYRWRTGDAGPLLSLSRAQIAAGAELYRHCATIHSVIHFAWFCGFHRVRFIGCDGINDPGLLGGAYHAPTGYNPRIENRSRTVPWWQYDAIRRIQDALCARLELQAEYIGTPRPSGYSAIKKFILFSPRDGNAAAGDAIPTATGPVETAKSRCVSGTHIWPSPRRFPPRSGSTAPG